MSSERFASEERHVSIVGADLGLVLAWSTNLLMATWNPWYSPRYTSDVGVLMKGSLGYSYLSSSGLIMRMSTLVTLGLFTVNTDHSAAYNTASEFFLGVFDFCASLFRSIQADTPQNADSCVLD